MAITWKINKRMILTRPDEFDDDYVCNITFTDSEQGTVLIWPASFTHTHRGNPPYSQNKYTITSWFNLTSYTKFQKTHIR
jgi:hypothetical protein